MTVKKERKEKKTGPSLLKRMSSGLRVKLDNDRLNKLMSTHHEKTSPRDLKAVVDFTQVTF